MHSQNRLHAAFRSKHNALEAPIAACTRHAVLGMMLSGVIVDTIIRPISSAKISASKSAFFAAQTAKEETVSFSAI